MSIDFGIEPVLVMPIDYRTRLPEAQMMAGSGSGCDVFYFCMEQAFFAEMTEQTDGDPILLKYKIQISKLKRSA